MGTAACRFIALMTFFFICVAPTVPAAEERGGQATPDAARGKRIFTKYCAGCHGREGRGDGYRLLGPAPADLTAPAMKGRSDAEMLRTIHEGKPNMPAWNVRLSSKDSRDVIEYIRSLGQ